MNGDPRAAQAITDEPTKPLNSIYELLAKNNEVFYQQVCGLENVVGRATGEQFPSAGPIETPTPQGILGEIGLALERNTNLVNQLTAVTRALESLT